MSRHLSFLAAALAVAGSLAIPTSGQAMPVSSDLSKVVPSPTEQVQWRGGGGGWHGGGPGWHGGGPGWRGGPGWGGPGWRGGGPGWGAPGWRGPGWGWRGPGWRGPGWGGPGWGGGWGYRPVVVGPGWGGGWGPGWGGCGWGGCGWGPGVGFASGVVVGSALAAQPVYAAPAVSSNAVAYCMQRFRSYNPATGTYLGYDGRRHACP